MSLDDILKKANQEDEAANKAKLLAQEEKSRENAEFVEAAKDLEQTVVIPTIQKVHDTFKDNKYHALIGREYIKKSLDGTLWIHSLSVKIRKVQLQIDVIADRKRNAIRLDSYNAPNMASVKNEDWPVGHFNGNILTMFIEAAVEEALNVK